MDVIPSLDLLGGNVVRLLRGDFANVTAYGDPETVLDSLDVPRGSRLHIVDLEASRSGHPVETDVVRRLSTRGLRIQAGGGIVADSVPENEYMETVNKSRALIRAINLAQRGFEV